MDEITIRCSSLGNVMTSDRSGKAMGDTAKTALDELYIKNTFGRRKVVVTQEMSKGIECEEESISLLTAVNGEFYEKNSTRFHNDFINGEPDIIASDRVIDIKTSWDIFTFGKTESPFTKSGKPTAYGWQLIGYMWLIGRSKATLAYCLVNTPHHLVEGIRSGIRYKMNVIDGDNDEGYQMQDGLVTLLHEYDDIPKEKRVRQFDFEMKQEYITAIEQRVEEAREYYKMIQW